MKERPILFSAPMVRALLDGSKTQTRRVVKRSNEWPVNAVRAVMLETRGTAMAVDAQRCTYGPEIKCPYGQPGDRLWVRETYWHDDEDNAILYAADPDEFAIVSQNKSDTGSSRYNWRPSIFMPRCASRITLEITAVRVERLQDISEADAIAEGVHAEPCGHARLSCSEIACWGPTAKGAYGWLWEEINGPESWEVNPWVWVIEFKKVTA